MKKGVRLTVMLFMLVMAGNVTLIAQQGMRGMRGMRPDSTMMNRMEQMQRPGMGMRGGMGQMRMAEMPPRYVMRQQAQGFRHQRMDMGQFQGGMRQFDPGLQGRMPLIYNIPNLTDKQKKDIADLRGKQQAEMEKLRIDMQSKMKEMREAHRAKIMSLLTDEQKKWVEENSPLPADKK